MEIGGIKRKIIVRLVETKEKVQAACDLINDRYAWRGYGASHRLPTGPDHVTFTAEIDDQVVGTITLAVDLGQGLAVDKTFRGELDRYRALPGKILCELTQFAFSPFVQSRELMAALFHIVFVYGHRTFHCSDLFIEVNPRHVRFYEAMLGFQRVGSVGLNEKVSAPAQLMRLEVAMIRERIDRAAGERCRADARSLYPFFFSPKEEEGIYSRLAQAEPQIVDYASDAEAGEDNLIQKDAADHRSAAPAQTLHPQANVTLVRCRRIVAPIRPNPQSIIAQVAASGTAAAEKVAVPE